MNPTPIKKIRGPPKKHTRRLPPPPYTTKDTMDATNKKYTNTNPNTIRNILAQSNTAKYTRNQTHNIPQWNTSND